MPDGFRDKSLHIHAFLALHLLLEFATEQRGFRTRRRQLHYPDIGSRQLSTDPLSSPRVDLPFAVRADLSERESRSTSSLGMTQEQQHRPRLRSQSGLPQIDSEAWESPECLRATVAVPVRINCEAGWGGFLYGPHSTNAQRASRKKVKGVNAISPREAWKPVAFTSRLLYA